jgi:hypothetical protein
MRTPDRFRTSVLAMALALTLPSMALAEDSEGETPPEEQKLAEQYAALPEAVKRFVERLQDLDSRYPDSAEADIKTLMIEEGESLALDYCAAIGIDGPCAPVRDKNGDIQYGPVVDEGGIAARGSRRWWSWLLGNSVNIGVIPETNACPAGASWTQIHMDDEDRRNANNRWGWLGAISSSANTTYRFCKLDALSSLNFRPLKQSGDQYDYAVVNMGLLCPSGARRYVRVEHNENWRNANSSAGDIFPNFRIYNTWFNFYCHYDGNSGSVLGQMSAFPQLGFPYGVFASHSMPGPYALARGRVAQDDEDWANWNGWWFGHGDQVMWGGRNTERSLAKVR